MTAQTLRDAAKVLRERAEAATCGPWMQNGFEYDDASDSFTYDVTTDGTLHSLAYSEEKPDAAYIATMHPGVGLGLAEWLDYFADLRAKAEELDMVEERPFRAALAVARAILGGGA